MECYLKKSCAKEHSYENAIPKYTMKTYRIGRLFDGAGICIWCALHLQDMTKPTANDTDQYRLEDLKRKFPNYWKVIQEVGLDKVRHELVCQWIEVEPDSTPTRPEQLYAKLRVDVDGTR